MDRRQFFTSLLAAPLVRPSDDRAKWYTDEPEPRPVTALDPQCPRCLSRLPMPNIPIDRLYDKHPTHCQTCQLEWSMRFFLPVNE